MCYRTRARHACVHMFVSLFCLRLIEQPYFTTITLTLSEFRPQHHTESSLCRQETTAILFYHFGSFFPHKWGGGSISTLSSVQLFLTSDQIYGMFNMSQTSSWKRWMDFTTEGDVEWALTVDPCPLLRRLAVDVFTIGRLP